LPFLLDGGFPGAGEPRPAAWLPQTKGSHVAES